MAVSKIRSNTRKRCLCFHNSMACKTEPYQAVMLFLILSERLIQGRKFLLLPPKRTFTTTSHSAKIFVEISLLLIPESYSDLGDGLRFQPSSLWLLSIRCENFHFFEKSVALRIMTISHSMLTLKIGLQVLTIVDSYVGIIILGVVWSEHSLSFGVGIGHHKPPTTRAVALVAPARVFPSNRLLATCAEVGRVHPEGHFVEGRWAMDSF